MATQILATHVLLPLVGCVLNALAALAIWLRGPSHRTNQLATAFVGLASWWGFCQVLWSSAGDAESAYFWHHVAAPGWTFIGPLGVHLLMQGSRAPRWVARVLPLAYAISAIFMVLHLTGPWLLGAAVPTAWGWGFESGPGHKWFIGFTFACVIPAITMTLRRIRHTAAPAERQQLSLIVVGIATPFLVAGLTAGFFPILGIQVPRLGSVSFAVLGVILAFSLYRFGFSALAPGEFSKEIIETLPSGLALVGLDGLIMTANARMGELLGMDPEGLAGFPIQRALSQPVISQPQEIRELELEFTRPTERESFPVAVSTSLLRDRRGLPIGVVLVVHDRREVVELRNRLVTSGRLAAVGELAAGIAHEINNPIAFVRANLSQLQRDWAKMSEHVPTRAVTLGADVDFVAEGEELIAECIEGVDRTVRIVKDVKGFARGGVEDRQPVDLNALLEYAIRVAQPQMTDGIAIECNFAELTPVLGTAPQLQQVFLNLLLNAYQASEAPGAIRVSTHMDGDNVAVRISDDGCGISAANRKRIFDPFFTTKPVGEGTGLGLAISFQIIESHRGQILVESESGVGTCFTVLLPTAESGGD